MPAVEGVLVLWKCDPGSGFFERQDAGGFSAEFKTVPFSAGRVGPKFEVGTDSFNGVNSVCDEI